MTSATGAALGLVLFSAAGAWAGPCSEDIASMDRQIEEKAKAAISSSTAGKETAAAREGRSVAARDRDTPTTALPNSPPPGTPEARATEQAQQAGAGGDNVMVAKATLNRARTLDQQGNAGACRDALAEAKRQLVE